MKSLKERILIRAKHYEELENMAEGKGKVPVPLFRHSVLAFVKNHKDIGDVKHFWPAAHGGLGQYYKRYTLNYRLITTCIISNIGRGFVALFLGCAWKSNNHKAILIYI